MPSSPTVRAGVICGVLAPGAGPFGVVRGGLGPGRGVEDRVGGGRIGIAAKNNSAFFRSRCCRARNCSAVYGTHRVLNALNLLLQPQRSGGQRAPRETRECMIAQSRRNAVTQDAICTWVARLRPSDRAAIAGEHMRCNPHANPRCARRRRCLGWRVDRNAPPGRRANCCCAASAHQWAVASPVRREACARHCSRGVRARKCPRPSRRSEAPRPANRPPPPSPPR